MSDSENYGALPPNKFQWMIGKTASQIHAVRKLEEYSEDFVKEPKEVTAAIEKIKKGKSVRGDETVQELIS
jgi:hypothetical protein